VTPNRRCAGLFALALLLMAAAGCSRVSLGYRTADFFIERFADDWPWSPR